MMPKSLLISASLLLTAVKSHSTTSPQQQQPLQYDRDGPSFDLINELYKAEIIPTVLDPFKPFLTISAEWGKKSAKIGNTIKPKKLQEQPDLQLRDDLPEFSAWNDNFTTGVPQLTLALTDPDAKAREDPKWSQMLHWLITDVNLTHTQNPTTLGSSNYYTEIFPYKAPSPPPKTGKHRYVFVALAPKNGTTEKLYLSKPKARQHWGYGKVRAGVREWAEENGLETVGANFFYAKDKKQ
ncbi:hypothetical protein AC578_10680 [Pseudocercospora eumusae]|uniref:Phosphatidylethanolamine-binding protein n=1 Tax=Pseudocercospora eumusae TaxID=321146 RepID=A0A139HJP1_9PEZI|nr:hypothetical protein AC578_10680 [Pseudocercospora eumusae]KXT02603.1 hypothetical protein AC578_10680 [Pseudocercospora eumusae]